MAQTGGGYLRGPWWRFRSDDETETRRCYVLAWGPIVKQPVDLYKKGLRSIRFVIKTGRGAGRNEKHLVCVCYGEKLSAVIMQAMERGDIVMALGTWVENLKPKTKKKNPTYEMQVGFIVPLGLIGYLIDLYSTQEIQEAVERHRNEDADVWESE